MPVAPTAAKPSARVAACEWRPKIDATRRLASLRTKISPSDSDALLWPL